MKKYCTILRKWKLNNIEFVHDKKVDRTTSKYRPDFLIKSNFGFIIIEVDEKAHRTYPIVEEINRMKTIYNDIEAKYPSSNVLFIRYNPDDYYDDKLVCVKMETSRRQDYLYLLLRYFMDLKELPSKLNKIVLFYDGFVGTPTIEEV